MDVSIFPEFDDSVRRRKTPDPNPAPEKRYLYASKGLLAGKNPGCCIVSVNGKPYAMDNNVSEDELNEMSDYYISLLNTTEDKIIYLRYYTPNATNSDNPVYKEALKNSRELVRSNGSDYKLPPIKQGGSNKRPGWD